MMRQPLFRNPGWRGALFYFGYWGVIGVFSPFINVYFTHLGLSGLQIGIFSALGPLMTLLVGPPLSVLADEHHWHKQILAVALGGMAVTIFLFGFPQTFLLLLPLVVLHTIFRSPTNPISNSLIARMAVRHHIDYGKLRVWGSLSFAIFSIACGALWDRVGFRVMFVASGLLYVPVMLSALTLEEGTPVQKYERRPLRHLGRDSGLVALLVATCLVGIAEGVYMTFSGVYMDHLGGAQVLVGGLFGLSAFAELPTMQFSGAISRKLGKPLTLIIAYGFMGLAFFGYGLVGIPSVMLLFGVAKGIGYGLYFAGTVSLIDERAPEVWSATVQSLMTATAWGLAPLLTVPLGGWIADVLGLPAVFICAGVAEALALVILAGALIGGKFDETPLIEASDA